MLNEIQPHRKRPAYNQLEGRSFSEAPVRHVAPSWVSQMAARVRLAVGRLYRALCPSYALMWSACCAFDREPLLAAGLRPSEYFKAKYMRLAYSASGEVGLLSFGRYDYLSLELLPKINPDLYVVRDTVGHPWGKVLHAVT